MPLCLHFSDNRFLNSSYDGFWKGPNQGPKQSSILLPVLVPETPLHEATLKTRETRSDRERVIGGVPPLPLPVYGHPDESPKLSLQTPKGWRKKKANATTVAI